MAIKTAVIVKFLPRKKINAALKAISDLDTTTLILTYCIERIDEVFTETPQTKEAFNSILTAITELRHAHTLLSSVGECHD